MKKIVGIMFILFMVSGCNKEEVNVEPIQLLAVMRADFGIIPKDKIPAGWNDILVKSGWKHEKDDVFIITVILKNINIMVDKKNFKTDENGMFIPNVKIEKASDVKLDYLSDGSNMDFVPTRIIGNKIILENTLDEWLDAGEDSHGGHNHGGRLDGGPMDDTRCLDYNGWAGNGVNYPKSHYLATVGFPGSDCNIAMLIGFCYLDHLRGGCTKNNGIKCSAYIGHPLYFHVH